MGTRKKSNHQFQHKPFSKELLSNCLLFLYQEEYEENGKDFVFNSQLRFNENIHAIMNNLKVFRKRPSKEVIQRNKKFKTCFKKEIENSKDFMKKLQLIKKGDTLSFPDAEKRYKEYQNGCKEEAENKEKLRALKKAGPVTGQVKVPAQQPTVAVKDIFPQQKKNLKNVKK